MTSRMKARTSSEICADCSEPGPKWASINRGVLICDECCSVHRSLGRHISQVRHLRLAPWNSSLYNMVMELVVNGANQIWEHSLSDSVSQRPSLRKPNPKDSVHPVKSNFIKAKYQMLAFVHRLPTADDRVSVHERSKQLYASARNSNLETSLRLISLGANPNYFNPEKGLSPLHLAAMNGQAMQCELLICHGADPSALDGSERTAAKLAIDNGHIELGFRLIELMYELTDRLTFYLCGRRPDHKNGINYLIPALQDRGIDVSSMAQEARCKLQSLNNRLFEELCSDIYDEVDRRENDAVWLATQHMKFMSDHTAVPFLPVNPSFSSTRNQGRQKLARFNALEFATMIVDLLHDAKRREGLNLENQSSGVVEQLKENPIVDTDPDYDEVHEDKEEVAANNNAIANTNRTSSTSFFTQESFYDIPNVIDDDDDYDDVFEPAAPTQTKGGEAKDEKGKLHELQEQNNSLGQEVNLLRSMVQKLMQENAALRAQVAQVMLERNDLEQRLQAALDGYSVPPKRSSVLGDQVNDKSRDDGTYDNVNVGDGMVPVEESSEESAAYRTEEDAEFNGPSQESIVDATEQITDKIQKLLKAAQSSNNSSYVECSSDISSAVNDMANLFPEHTGSENVRNALRLMITSAARLQVQCRSNVPDQAMLAQQVIQCAYDIAKAAKLVVTTYNTS